MAQAVSRRPLTAVDWEIRFQFVGTEKRKKERKKERQTDRKPFKVGSKSTEGLRKFRLSYRNCRCPIARQFLEHRIRKFNAEKISNTNSKYRNV
jgi:hypothetical protein